ncbi:hypothetical protein Q0Z83_016950 [Actinoplanes sichuanensis]|uniref:WD40 repeat domain-containing protein n=1 Tax=Actinoplanes sichuanensis TaxID=512349 RepID=A0ABW4A731_9ACTN|nr:WD40 repeat domain-containing protein [Actinoplanes sichuanensis]BEL03504.1 hypothetical protein Q0Z83_016950 [Actinoplanes sichuanensis]
MVINGPGAALKTRHSVDQMVAFRRADGRLRLLVVCADASVQVWDPVSGEPATTLHQVRGANDIAVCRRPGREPVLAVATDDGVEWFDAVSGDPCRWPTVDDTHCRLAVGRGGEVLYAAGFFPPAPVHRWDATTGTMLPPLGRHDDHLVTVAALTRSGGTDMVVTAGWAEGIQRWDAVTGATCGPPLLGHDAFVHELGGLLLPGGDLLLASLDGDGELRRWDAETGEPVGAVIDGLGLSGLGRNLLMINADGRPRILVTSDGIIRQWDAVTGVALADVAEGYGAVLLDLDGVPTIAAGCDDGIRLHPLPR